ncbi:MAG: hypothetical protein Q8L53_06905 [Aestuariivirga sp.]|nr:hypothetical protein [Aestuariivirga sp.]
MMKTCVSSFAFICFVSASTPGLAAAATAEEAQRLAGVFQTYLGKEPGVVTVIPSGEAYDVKVDLAPFLAKIPEPNFSAEVSPFEMKLADQGGGKWLVTQDSPFSFSAKIPGKFEVIAKVGAMKVSSVFDENLQVFISSTTEFADFSLEEIFTEPGLGPVHVTVDSKSMRYETTATASGADAVDGTIQMTMSGFFERITAPVSPASPVTMDVDFIAGPSTTETIIKGLKNRAINKLITWFIAHPSQASIKASQSELKAILGASLPLFENISSTGTLKDFFAPTTPIGPVSIANVGFNIGMNGIVVEGAVHEGFTVEGLTLPYGFVPPWATDLVPDKLALDFKISDFNLADPVGMLLDMIDLNEAKPTTPEENMKLLTALLPKGAVQISMGPSKVTSKVYDVDFEGSMTAGPVGVPLGAATIRAKGLDDVMKALQAAPPEMVGQAIPAVIAAKGMAKTEADGSLSWKIENTISGTVLVNGIDISKMGGGG